MRRLLGSAGVATVVAIRPWSAEMPFLATNGRIFEHACHEGNRDMGNILNAARVLEKKAAEAGAKKGSN